MSATAPTLAELLAARDDLAVRLYRARACAADCERRLRENGERIAGLLPPANEVTVDWESQTNAAVVLPAGLVETSPAAALPTERG